MSADEEEDDYLSMTFDDKPAKETSLQRTARLKKERAEKGRIPSKAERERAADDAREKALATEMDSSNKGAKMMAKMGFKGGALGKTENARTRPIEIQMKDDRGGIGMESEKKRKIREAAEELNANEKRVKLTEEEYRERNRLEREEKRHEGQMWSAMRTLEGFETEGEAGGEAAEDEVPGAEEKAKAKPSKKKSVPLRSINVLWRPLVKQQLEKERERRMRNDLAQSLSRRKDFNESDSEGEDKLALTTEIEEDLDEEDEELDEFLALPAGERLDKILAYLREKYCYCFWCKFRYSDQQMDGCPGLTEDEHG